LFLLKSDQNLDQEIREEEHMNVPDQILDQDLIQDQNLEANQETEIIEEDQEDLDQDLKFRIKNIKYY
jgi:hypothetical protein